MSINGQNPGPLVGPPIDGLTDQLVRPVVVRGSDMRPGRRITAHAHDWGQLLYAAEGVMAVYTGQGNWVVPPERAVWIPPRTDHGLYAPHGVKFRSLHVGLEFCRLMANHCYVMAVSSVMREMLVRSADLPKDYDEDGPDGRFMRVIIDQMVAAKPVPLHLPMPGDLRLVQITEALVADPSDSRGLEDFARDVGASSRTLARLFDRELGMTFRQWRQQRRLMASLEMLAAGEAVTSVALDLGYDSPSAFIAMFKRTLGVTPTAYFGR
ncbi:AraC family transcriptional regulator [Aestuariispira ectoiniformans]|uniref:AraC family transcriptional regulator n=1 Tax=Aestuariispira ectoiniformans TaxID=2775080 RepID=UPI00223B3965|nr:helix-turn-helix transcriptional regulator [Aestuariispira ectoiniformans]